MAQRLTKIDKDFAKRSRILIQSSLAPVFREFGLSVTVGDIHFTPDTMRPDLRLTLVPEGMDPSDKDAAKKVVFDKYIERLGGKKDWYGLSIRINKNFYTVIGCVPKARTNVIEVRRDSDGKEFVCKIADVVRSIEEGTAIRNDD